MHCYCEVRVVELLLLSKNKDIAGKIISGYADDHTGDVYRFINFKTQNVILSRDARWMNAMWKTYMRKQKHISHGLWIIDEDYELDEEEIRENWFHQQPEDEISLVLDIDMIGRREENLGSTRSQTLEMRSPSNQSMERENINMDNWIQETCYISAITSGLDKPNNFNEAWNHQCQSDRRKWRVAITKELYCIENKKVWKIIHKTDIPKTGRLIGCK